MKEGCGIFIAQENKKLIHCGEKLFGKIRYCVCCSQNLKDVKE